MTENISFTKTNHLESPKLLLTVLLYYFWVVGFSYFPVIVTFVISLI